MTTTAPGAGRPMPGTDGDRQPTQVRRTLLLLPALVGLAGVAATIAAGPISGMTDGSRGWTFTVVAALLVLATVLTGGSYGMYVAFLVVVIGTLVADGGPNLAELVGTSVSLILIHELVRFSLDARRPARFGPGVIVGYLTRTIGVALLTAAGIALSWLVADRVSTPVLLVPIAVAVAALPLFARDAAERIDQRLGRFGPGLRAAVAAAATVGILLVVVIGAQARTEIVGDRTPSAPLDRTTTATVDPIEVETAEGTGRSLPSWVPLLFVLAVAVAIFFILRRPEAFLELEETERQVESNSFDLAVTGLADSDDEMVEVDEQTLAGLLYDLQLDISAEQDPGRAIRFGYAKIEQQLADLSIIRAEAETEREFLLRALPSLGDAGDAMTVLTRLFERARFGVEPADEDMRQRALIAIDELLTQVAGPSGGGPGNGAGP